MRKNIQHNQPHPGEILKELYFEPLKLSVKTASDITHIPHDSLSSIIDGAKSISTETALKLSVAFDTNQQLWLNLQINYDLSRGQEDQRK